MAAPRRHAGRIALGLGLGLAFWLAIPGLAAAQTRTIVTLSRVGSGARIAESTRGAEAIYAALSRRRDAMPLDRILSQIASNPDLSQNPEVMTFLVQIGEGKITLVSRSPRLKTIAEELPEREQLVASLGKVLAGNTSSAQTRMCNPMNQWLGSGFTPQRIRGTFSMRTQERTLAQILTAPGDVIEIDLDGTSLMPVSRTLRALRLTGERFGIDEFAHPEQLALLPFYTGGGFQAFLDQTGIDDAYPDLDWTVTDGRTGRGEVYRYFRNAYWRGDLQADQVTPGLAAFVDLAAEYGKTVVFLSGRASSRRDVSIKALEFGGVADPQLVIGQQGGSDQATKRLAQRRIRQRWGEPAVIIDDRVANRLAVQEVVPDILMVPIRVPGFSSENPQRGGTGISTFEIRESRYPD